MSKEAKPTPDLEPRLCESSRALGERAGVTAEAKPEPLTVGMGDEFPAEREDPKR